MDLEALLASLGAESSEPSATGSPTESPAQASRFDSGEIASIVFKIIIYIVGTIGNILVIFVILYLKEYKKITHWYVLQLAVADLVFLQTLAVTISANIEQNWKHHESMCKTQEAILFINYYSSILFLMIMAIDRYLAVCHGLAHGSQVLRSRSSARIITAVTWVASVLLAVPVILYSKLVGNKNSCRCEIRYPKDAEMWCEEQGYLTKDTMEKCLVDDFPNNGKDIDNQCSDDDDDFLLSLLSGLSGTGDTNSNNTIPDLDFGSGFVLNFSAPSEESFNINDILTGGGNSSASGTNGFTVPTSGIIASGCIYGKDRPGFPVFILFNFIVMFCVPLMVVIMCYSLIVLRLKKRMVGGRKQSSGDTSHSSSEGTRRGSRGKSKKHASASHSEKRRVTVMCAILVLLFAGCWLPFHAMHIAKYNGIVDKSTEFCNVLTMVTSILAYLNSALDPYLYNFLGTFGKRMKQVRDHERTRTIFSGTQLSRIGKRSSENTIAKSKRSSSHDRSMSITQNENKPLNEKDANEYV